MHHLDKLNSFPAIAFELFSSMARALSLCCKVGVCHRHSHCIFSAGTRGICVQYIKCTSRMRSQSQTRNYKYKNDAIHDLHKLNSFPALAFEL